MTVGCNFAKSVIQLLIHDPDMRLYKSLHLTKKTNILNYMISVCTAYAYFSNLSCYYSLTTQVSTIFPCDSFLLCVPTFASYVYKIKTPGQKLYSSVHVCTTCSYHLFPKCYLTFTILVCILPPSPCEVPLLSHQIIEYHVCETQAFHAQGNC